MLLGAVVVWAVVVGLCACQQAKSGVAFVEPTVASASGGVLALWLRLDATHYEGTSVSFWTRGYNGGVPGPTLRAQPGDRVQVTFHNALRESATGVASSVAMHSPNTTSLLFDTLHFRSPWDSREMGGGSTHTLEGQLDGGHQPGTHLYYSHFKGSAALQFGGGAVGVFVVEDVRGSVSTTIRNMPESVLLLQRIAFASLRDWAQEASDNVFSGATLPSQDVTLVNGRHRPVLTMQANEWHRFRVVWATVDASVRLAIEGCELEVTHARAHTHTHTHTQRGSGQVLAKDGVYLAYSRPTWLVELVPRGRVDLAVACRQAGTFYLTYASIANDKQDDMGMGMEAASLSPSPSPSLDNTPTDFILQLEVEAGGSTALSPATIGQTFAVVPSYLDSLLDDADVDSHSVILSSTAGGCIVNHAAYAGDALFTIFANRTQEWSVAGVEKFPFWLQGYPFQIAEVESPSGYHVVGDWMSSIGTIGGDSIVRIRFRADGDVVFQASNLAHSDRGCYGWAQDVEVPATEDASRGGGDGGGFPLGSVEGIATMVVGGLAVLSVVSALAKRRAASLHKKQEVKQAQRDQRVAQLAPQPPQQQQQPPAAVNYPHLRYDAPEVRRQPPVAVPNKLALPRLGKGGQGSKRRAEPGGSRASLQSGDPRHQASAFYWENTV